MKNRKTSTFKHWVLSAALTVTTILCLSCAAYAAELNVSVPASLPIYVNAAGESSTATNAVIKNNGDTSVEVASITVKPGTGWTLATQDAVANASKGDKKIAIGFNGSWADSAGTVDVSSFDAIVASSSITLNYSAKVPAARDAEAQSEAATATIVVQSNVPTLAAGSGWYKSKVGKSTITEISFVDSYTPTTKSDETWNADIGNTGKIKAYRTGTTIVVTGNGSGTIMANPSCYQMFYGFSKLTDIDLSNFDTSNVTDMGCMFEYCSSLTSLDLSNFNTNNVTKMSFMFEYCSKLTILDISAFNTSNVTDMSNMFNTCSSLTSLDLSNFNTNNVTKMSWMFYSCSKLTSLDVSKFNTSKVTSMYDMFGNCNRLTSLDLSNFNTSKVTDMSYMFGNCNRLTSLNISKFDTSNVTIMKFMFTNCAKLTSLDISNFITNNVTNMNSMFNGCSGLTCLDLSNFNTSNVTDMRYMFQNCNGLTSLDISKFNTSKVTDMGYMFKGCRSFTSLDVSNFDTSKVTTMSYMFSENSNLTTIYAGNNWDTSNVTISTSMFYKCSKLVGAIAYNSSKTDATYANWTTGYLTHKTTSQSIKLDVSSDGSVNGYTENAA